MTFFFLLKNKIAAPIRGRISAAFTAAAAGAVPSTNVKDMQQEGKRTLNLLPLIYSRVREVFLFLFLREGSKKAEHEMADKQGFKGV